MTPPQLIADTVALLDDLESTAAHAQLPPPPEVLRNLRARLAEDSFNVLVVGEAKRGKSTFVNALIGRDVLPTDVGISTSQVFAVRRADREAYRLRFEDGAERSIDRGDLERYGSQVAADRGAGAVAERALRWIEVDVPAQFLPERVTILDTPGLGALHASHAEITRRFVPQADAVVLVLDSGQPAGEREIELLEAIVEVTRNVFLIQTKIDQHGREEWELTRSRSQTILAERLGDRLPSTAIWPVSSANLRRAAASDTPEALLIVSRYRDLAAALRAFLTDVCAAPRARDTMLVAARAHQAGERILTARVRSLEESSQQRSREHREAAAARSKQFEKEWGEHGAKRRELLQAVRRVTTLGKQSFRDALQPGGRVVTRMEARIDATTTLAEVNAVGAVLAAETTALATDEWVRATDLARSRWAEALAPVLEDAEAVLGTELDDADLHVAAPERRFMTIEDRTFDRLKGASGAVGAVGLAVALVAPMVASLAVPIALGGMLWAFHRGWSDVGEMRAKAAQGELHRHLRAVLQHVQQHFFAVDLAVGRLSRVDEHFSAAEEAVLEHVDTIVRRHVAETRKEIARLEEQARLAADDRARELEREQGRLSAWHDLGRRMLRLADAATQTTPTARKEAA